MFSASGLIIPKLYTNIFNLEQNAWKLKGERNTDRNP